MTDASYTHIAILVDRSGSMQSIASDAQGGVNALIKEQREKTGANERCTVSLAQFDDQYELLWNFQDIRVMGDSPYTLKPRNSTALLDSIGKLINNTGEKLRNTPEHQRPANVVFVIATDGYENASKEFNRAQINNMITHQTEKYGWKFVYIGANQDAIKVASDIGISLDHSLTYAASGIGTRSAYASTSNLISSVRAGGNAAYNQDDRDQAVQQ